jgi:drug/metabolite transporter (DMT)-like permease
VTPKLPALRRLAPPVDLRWGVGLATAAAVISGVSVFVNGAAVRALPDAALYTTLKNGAAALVLLALAATTTHRAEVRALDRRAWLALAAIGVIGGSVPFLLFFAGLAQASAPAAAFIQKSLFLWVALLAVPFLGERLGLAQVIALVVLLGGQALVAGPTGIRWGAGESMIAAATLLWAVESVVARRLLAGTGSRVPATVLGAARLGFGLVVLVGYLGLTGRLAAVGSLSAGQWGIAIGTGLLLSAYVVTWFSSLRRAPASLVTSVLVLGAPITAILQVVASGRMPDLTATLGLALIVGAVAALAASAWRAGRVESTAATAPS